MLSVRDITISSALRVREILGFLNANRGIKRDIADDIYGIYPSTLIETKLSIEIGLLFGWVEMDSSNYISITQKGERLWSKAGKASDPNAWAIYFISFLKGLLVNCAEREVLLHAAIWGREKFIDSISEAEPTYCKDIHQILKYAGLTDILYENTEQLEFWIWLKKFAREQIPPNKSHNNDIGNEGETLSVNYEKNRTGQFPVRSSIDDDGLGFDLKSVISSKDQRSLFIEVKCSTLTMDIAEFHISETQFNACKKATTSEDFPWVLHLWLLSSSGDSLAVIEPEDILKHLPKNSGRGIWEKCRVPYDVFKDKFLYKFKREAKELESQ